MNLKILYENWLLKMLSLLVFLDSFLLIFVGMGVKGGTDLLFSAIYGFLGGVVAMAAFNVMAIIVIAWGSK